MKPYPILIVGQGIAGTALHAELSEHGWNCVVLDQPLKGASSHAAAGLINPITGPKYSLSWMYDSLESYFVPFYYRLSEKLSNEYLLPTHYLRIIELEQQKIQWNKRMGDLGFQKYISSDTSLNVQGHQTGLSKFIRGYRLKMIELITDYRSLLSSQNQLIVSSFDFEALHFDENFLTYQENRYSYIVFAEGWRMVQNPYFYQIPIVPNKGVALKITDFDYKYGSNVLKKKHLAAPVDDYLWYGGTMSKAYEQIEPTAEELESLTNDFSLDFEQVLSSQQWIGLAGIRPTVPDRRPIIGPSQIHSLIWCFNGLGTKGSSLAPLMAKWIADSGFDFNLIPSEVKVSRFWI